MKRYDPMKNNEDTFKTQEAEPTGNCVKPCIIALYIRS